MNHKKVKKQINKINSFFDSITADEEISNIEKDLLLSYVRKLYESILDSADSTPSKAKKVVRSTMAPVEKVVKEVRTAAPEPEVMKTVMAQPVVERKPFERAETTTKPTAETLVEAAAVVATAATPTIEKSTPSPVVPSPTLTISENMEAIFAKSGGNEISDRLSSTPIKDLTKSMGINERMFTIKELFGGDQNRFNTVLNDLNGMSNFDEAKSYLIDGIATDLNWDDAGTYKKALNFVKLVQRRYS